ncbi:hypothetical protein SCAB_27471 [Streptomyces scabiei 87.22]|uniref:Uncharacterized protein n=1 Tax=Streptomyces scabiei (strain 87.22) TaxID=680198 RepID=C9Z5E0_STRSW|nr:hypothetical protein SCAB_27471 [Streptomyces scabiei 87.22]
MVKGGLQKPLLNSADVPRVTLGVRTTPLPDDSVYDHANRPGRTSTTARLRRCHFRRE